MSDNQAFVSVSNDILLKVSAQPIKGMFKFITRTVNPLGGQCQHNCIYCWRHDLVRRFTKLQNKYLGKPKLDFKQLKPIKNKKELIFLCTMTDLFASNVPDHMITTILNFVENSEATFLLQTKNPKRFQDFLTKIPANTILGSTIESNRHYPQISKAPTQKQRLHWMAQLAKKPICHFLFQLNPYWISI